jgi:hypothetical protein
MASGISHYKHGLSPTSRSPEPSPSLDNRRGTPGRAHSVATSTTSCSWTYRRAEARGPVGAADRGMTRATTTSVGARSTAEPVTAIAMPCASSTFAASGAVVATGRCRVVEALAQVNTVTSMPRHSIVTELVFHDRHAYENWVATMYAANSGVAADEATFLDRSRTRSYIVEEHTTSE